jgi:hypothetical protein
MSPLIGTSVFRLQSPYVTNIGKPCEGSSWPAVVEFVGESGAFDYVEFVAEYAPFDLTGLDNFCRSAELSNLSSMIKVDQEQSLGG